MFEQNTLKGLAWIKHNQFGSDYHCYSKHSCPKKNLGHTPGLKWQRNIKLNDICKEKNKLRRLLRNFWAISVSNIKQVAKTEWLTLLDAILLVSLLIYTPLRKLIQILNTINCWISKHLTMCFISEQIRVILNKSDHSGSMTQKYIFIWMKLY